MTPHGNANSSGPKDLARHYESGYEEGRLRAGVGRLESERSCELLLRFLPPPPAKILDVGGGPGGYACWLARRRYEVHLIDIVPLHVEMALKASTKQPHAPLASARVGDARALQWEDTSVDAVLLFGPLYHLIDQEDRVGALREAHRVLKPEGIVVAVGISRFASAFGGLRYGYLKDPTFVQIVQGDLKDGHHTNPTGHPRYFTESFFHHPEELLDEVTKAGFSVTGPYGVEGPSWLAPDFDEWWNNQKHRQELIRLARMLETEPSLLGVSAHLMVVGTK